MAESITVARPYTKAAFATALAQGDLGSWSEFLHLAAAAVIDADMKTALAVVYIRSVIVVVLSFSAFQYLA